MKKSSVHLPFLFIVSALFIFLVGTQLAQDGMFMDGLLYVCVAKNLAVGLGTFWNPYFSETLYPSYHQQLPLMPFLESLFFRLFGTGIYVERFYCLVVLLVSVFLIIRIWKILFQENKELQKFYWFALLLFIVIPTTGWSYSNNMAEGTMGVFVLLSIYFILKSLKEERLVYFYLLLAGCSLFFASLCKGIQGMFPLVSILLFWIATRKISLSKSILFTAILAVVPVTIYGILLLDETVVQSFRDYYYARLHPSFNNTQAATTANRFHLIRKMTLALLPAAGLSLLIVLLRKKIIQQAQTVANFRSEGVWLLLLALSGSLPLIVTLEQRTFYIVTALPYYALAFAYFTAHDLALIVAKLQSYSNSFKIFRAFTIFVFAASVITTLFLFGKVKRDKELLSDVYAFGSVIPSKTVLKVSAPLWGNWSMHGYFMRSFGISLYSGEKHMNYFVVESGTQVPKEYVLLEKGSRVELYKFSGSN
ncbi:MAG: glycosyltransferase family 39 protein [Chitinophagales bacterium]|nr:glycosyltransferase family 39 protein [Chitinophagales bacterium]